MAKLALPSVRQSRTVTSSFAALLAQIKQINRRHLPRTSSSGRGAAHRDPALADELSVRNYAQNLEEFAYRKARDEVTAQRSDRDYDLRQTTETRQQREGELKQMKDAVDREKTFTHKWVELWQKAGEQDNLALQQTLSQSYLNYRNGMSPQMQKLIDPLVQSGPFSQTAQKVERFKRMNPRPQVTADAKTESLAWAQQQTAGLNWDADVTGLQTGKRPEVKSLIGIGEKLYLSTENGGQIMDEESLQLAQMAKDAKVPLQSLLTNGGYWGKTNTITAAGVKKTVAPFTDLKGVTKTKVLGKEVTKEYEDLTNFMAEWGVWEDLDESDREKRKNSMVGEVYNRLDAGQSMEIISEELLKPRFGVNFLKLETVKEGKLNRIPILNWVSNNPKHKLVAVPGEPVAIEGKKFYYDEIEDKVYDKVTGQDFGGLEEVRREIQRQQVQIQTEAENNPDRLVPSKITKKIDYSKSITSKDTDDYESILKQIQSLPESKQEDLLNIFTK